MKKLLFIPILVLTLGVGCAKQADSPDVGLKTDTKIEATKVGVKKFYNGTDQYSVSISNGNRSTCVWTWASGSGNIPYSQTTYAESSTEKHVIDTYIDNYGFKVICIDDFGNVYKGLFPNQQ